MRLIKFLNEKRDSSTGLGADGLSKQKLKTLLYKETKKCTYNKLYKDTGWNGPQCIWDTFNKLNLNWNIIKSEYRKQKEDKMPSSKVWDFEIHWENDKGRYMKMVGQVIAAGAGSVEDPLDRYDLNMVVS
jgi:hypothetical protein